MIPRMRVSLKNNSMRCLLFVLCLSLLSACGVIYHPVEKQGLEITADRLEKIEKGMSKSEVHFYLGQPSILDPLSPERWEYLYTEKNRGIISEEKRLSLIFEDGKLAEINNKL